MDSPSGLQFTLTIDGLTADKLVLIDFTGDEGLSSLYKYQINLASRDETINAQQTVDRHACLAIYQDGELQHQVSGIVSQFTKGDSGHHFTRYQLTLVPAAARLALRHNSRIFQQQSVADIISIILQEMQIDDYGFSLSRSLSKREYCVQYRETDLEFIERLAAEEGIFYAFIYEQNKHTIVFSDDSQTLTKQPIPYPYNATSGGVSSEPYIQHLQLHTQIAPSNVSLKDYSFKKPQYSFLSHKQGGEIAYQAGDYEHFDAPGRYKDDDAGKAISQARLEYLRRDSIVATTNSNIIGIQAASLFDLIDHNQDHLNRDWFIAYFQCEGKQPQSLEEEGGEGATTYNNTLTLLPAHRQWRPQPNAKPRVHGPQIATVVGPQGEEIFCDEHGRVKVQFPWDRYGNSDDKSSCWLRVSHDWAGGQYGMLALPRIGHEVIVSFLEGDPDQPIITGRTYHAVNNCPYSLPDNKTRTVICSETHQGQGFNELSFEDQAGQEQIYLHAQKDLNLLVQHDRADQILHDKHLEVEQHQFSEIKVNDYATIDKDSREHIKADKSQVTEAKQHLKQQSAMVQAGSEIHLTAGSKIVIEAGAELTLKAGSSFAKVDPAGVHLSGAKVNINSGGSAGKGSEYGGNNPALPFNILQPEISNPLPLQLAPATMQMLAVANIPLVQLCQKQTDGSCPLADCPCRGKSE